MRLRIAHQDDPERFMLQQALDTEFVEILRTTITHILAQSVHLNVYDSHYGIRTSHHTKEVVHLKDEDRIIITTLTGEKRELHPDQVTVILHGEDRYLILDGNPWHPHFPGKIAVPIATDAPIEQNTRFIDNVGP